MKRGFTLIELSIVLVIIGLVVGGILFGSQLIKVAEIKAATREVQQLNLAMRTFQIKYNGIAGDMMNYTQFFGATCTGISTYDTPPGPDGNGSINNSDEVYYSMCELKQAGFIGDTISAPAGWIDPSGIMRSKVWRSNYIIPISGSRDGNAGTLSGFYIAWDTFPPGTNNPWSWLVAIGPGVLAALSPADTYSMDLKYDDGLPASGKIMARGVRDDSFCTDAVPTMGPGSTLWLVRGTQYQNTTSSIKDCVLNFMSSF